MFAALQMTEIPLCFGVVTAPGLTPEPVPTIEGEFMPLPSLENSKTSVTVSRTPRRGSGHGCNRRGRLARRGQIHNAM